VGRKKHQITQVKFFEDAINRIAVMPVKACPGRDPGPASRKCLQFRAQETQRGFFKWKGA
jgi:hypothetical protein